MQQELGPRGIQVQAVLPGATRTEIWERAGVNLSHLPADMVMDAEEMVDAALAGLDQKEAVTIPSLPDIADWQKLTEARFALGPNLSRQHAAARYGRGRSKTMSQPLLADREAGIVIGSRLRWRRWLMVALGGGLAAAALAWFGTIWVNTGQYWQSTDDAYVGGNVTDLASKVAADRAHHVTDRQL